MNPGVSVARPVALRTALIWRDEVMSDIVADAPQKITIGHKGKPTFIVPDVGLPPGFAIVSPGNRGYVLTLAEGMRGTICIDGQEHEVADYVQREGGSAAGGFCATPISGRDWGVIDLDDSGVERIGPAPRDHRLQAPARILRPGPGPRSRNDLDRRRSLRREHHQRP